MALQSGGAISLSNIQTEFGGEHSNSLSEYYNADKNGGIPSSGEIKFSNFYSKLQPSSALFLKSGTWVCPPGVTSVCVVCIGAGGGGMHYSSGTYAMAGGAGGALSYKNNYAVTPGTSYTVTVGTGGMAGAYSTGSTAGGQSIFASTSVCHAAGGAPGRYATPTASTTSRFGDGGGDGGGVYHHLWSSGYGPQGGGGAGGYSGSGGTGGYNSVGATSGAGGAGAGGSNNGTNRGYSGGGVGVYGQGLDGTAMQGMSGGSGSGGAPGSITDYHGKLFGAGGGGSTLSAGGNGANGAVRIMWGNGRSFPSTKTGILDENPLQKIAVFVASSNSSGYYNYTSGDWESVFTPKHLIVGFLLHSLGRNITRTFGSPDISNYIELDGSGIDFNAQHYTLSADRVDCEVLFYNDSNTYIGKFRYQKTINTWSTGDYTNIEFYNASGTKILDVPSSNFSGTTYGNGRLNASIDFSDPSQIRFIPNATVSNTHAFWTIKPFTVSHPFGTATKFKFQPLKCISTYSSGSSTCFVSPIYYQLPSNKGK